MKIQLVNSPFDFDEVGVKTATRWFTQGRGYFTPDGKTLVLYQKSRWLSNQREAENDGVTGKFNWFVGESGYSYMQQIEGIGGSRGYQAAHKIQSEAQQG